MIEKFNQIENEDQKEVVQQEKEDKPSKDIQESPLINEINAEPILSIQVSSFIFYLKFMMC